MKEITMKLLEVIKHTFRNTTYENVVYCGFRGERKTGELRWKHSEKGGNQQQTQPKYDTRLDSNSSQLVEASALATAPPLLPFPR